MPNPVISFFHMTPAEVRNTPGLHQHLRYMGVRHLEMQLLRSVVKDEDQPTYEREWDKFQGADMAWCKAEGWRIIGRLDDGFHTVPEREAFKRSREKVEFVARRTSEYGVCDGIEVVDEIQQDPRDYPIVALSAWWWDGSPLAFPGHAPQRFEKLPIADYISRQWNWWTCRNQRDRLARLRGSLIDVPRDGREICAMIDVSGWRYRKMTMGTDYQRGKDARLNGRKPPTVRDIEEMFDLAREMGATRFRLYAWDGTEWKRNRMAAPPGAELQTGLGLTDGRWDGVEMVIKKLMMKQGVSDSTTAV